MVFGIFVQPTAVMTCSGLRKLNLRKRGKAGGVCNLWLLCFHIKMWKRTAWKKTKKKNKTKNANFRMKQLELHVSFLGHPKSLVGYCYNWSFRRPLIFFFLHFNLLLWNHWANFDGHIWHRLSLGGFHSELYISDNPAHLPWKMIAIAEK